MPVELSFDLPAQVSDKNITKEVSRNIQMIVKEALQNIVKHAKATKVFIKINLESQFHMVIEDNGCGYDQHLEPQGNGLKNMRTRSEAIRAILKRRSSPGNGTRVELSIPLETLLQKW